MIIYSSSAKEFARLNHLVLNYINKPIGENVIPMCLAVMVEFLIVHPFENANGRTFRFLVYHGLRKAGVLRAPVLPLAPLHMFNRKLLCEAYLSGELDDDWSLFASLCNSYLLNLLSAAEEEFVQSS